MPKKSKSSISYETYKKQNMKDDGQPPSFQEYVQNVFLQHTKNRDKIMEYEAVYRKQELEIYDGKTRVDVTKPKFFVTFPYPYMNGRLHLGHAFTLMKADIMARLKRKQGFEVLFPFAFHGSGTPIVSCADKVKMGDAGQIKILRDMDVPEEEIRNFTDPYHWIRYFPEKAVGDLKNLAVSADFQRSFMTTSMNPHYDSFIQWQFEKLRKVGVLTYGKRHMIFSPDTNQPCSDHDRSKGEGVSPLEYTLIKLPLVETVKTQSDLCLLAATLRPETLYGQTNIWVNKKGVYALFNYQGTKCIARIQVYRNFCYQVEDKSSVQLLDENFITGQELIGCHVNAPMTSTPISIYHMEQVSMNRGTGIVTSVPSDSPTDYLYWREICKKKGTPMSIKEIIEVKGDRTIAVTGVESSKIKVGQKAKLEELHQKIYLEEHEHGIMLVGDHEGVSTKEAHGKIKSDLISSEDGIVYYEPQTPVISRSGVECVVSLTEQWYINYGHSPSKTKIQQYIDDTLNVFYKDAKKNIQHAAGWICEWPCSRHYGLGTKLPVDPNYLIDSLSDSTIYMAYYTICHQILKIPVEDLGYDVWEYIFISDAPKPAKYETYQSVFDQMKQEFQYWYPMDMRISGKDLLKNHLVMSLFNHEFIWKDEAMYPRAYYTNGHLVLNGEKMSKSTGNFMTLAESVKIFGTDPTRMALILSGDGMTDSNFDIQNVIKAITLITNETNEIVELFNKLADVKPVPTDETNLLDNVFQDEVNFVANKMMNQLEKVEIRGAFVGIFDLINIKSEYKMHHSNEGVFKTNMIHYVNVFLEFVSIFMPYWYNDFMVQLPADITAMMNTDQPLKPKPFRPIMIWKKDMILEIVKNVKYIMKKKAKKKQGPKGANTKIRFKITTYDHFKSIDLDVIRDYFASPEHIAGGEIFSSKMLLQMVGNRIGQMGKQEKAKRGSRMGICARMFSRNIVKYGMVWMDSCLSGNDEMKMENVAESVSELLNDETITIVHANETVSTVAENNYNPCNPKIEIM